MSLIKRKKKAPALPIVEGKRWYSIREAAQYMAGHVWAIRELIRTGKLPYRKLGRGFVVDKIDMDQFLTNKAA